MTPMRERLGSERGAVLVHVAIALLGLVAFSTFAFDYGVLWAARRQAQNSADAAAMAGAITLAYGGMDNFDGARQRAIEAAALNLVWGEAPDDASVDVTVPYTCPPGSPAAGEDVCIRVDVYRNQETGNALPTFFGRLAGVDEQGVRATATAQVMISDSTDCVKPFAIPDKWLELNPKPKEWDENDSFRRYDGKTKAVMNPADYYEPPGARGGKYGPNGTGFTSDSVVSGGGDHGRYVMMKAGNPQQSVQPGWYYPVVINPAEGPGGNNYRGNISECDATVIGPGTLLDMEPGNMVGPTVQGMEELIAKDPDADWDPHLYGRGQGGIVGGCMARGTCAISPRLIALPVFDPDVYDKEDPNGRSTVTVTKVIGFFIDKNMPQKNVAGWITHYPGPPRGGMATNPEAAFVVTIILVR